VHDEAEQLEHVVSDRLIERIDEMLGRPEADPHGDPIRIRGTHQAAGRAEPADAARLRTPVHVSASSTRTGSFLRFIEQEQSQAGRDRSRSRSATPRPTASACAARTTSRSSPRHRARQSKLLGQHRRGDDLVVSLREAGAFAPAARGRPKSDTPTGSARPWESHRQTRSVVEEAVQPGSGRR
jgi:hypothetical protein